LCIELDGAPAAALVAQPRPDLGTVHLLDLRVDYDFRRQGLGTALACAVIGHARESEARAITAETRTDNFPAMSFLRKLGFEPAGLDTHRFSNHDLVKERATLLWALALD
jgi:ribosomal protein S18 acetylase RimI-like enzyme